MIITHTHMQCLHTICTHIHNTLTCTHNTHTHTHTHTHRAKIETDYGNSLVQLARKCPGRDEIG